MNEYPFPGPAPVLEPPDMDAVAKAEISLALAQSSNDSGHAPGITLQDAETLLKWIVAISRQRLQADLPPHNTLEDASGILGGRCSLAQSQASHMAEMLRLDTRRLASSDFYHDHDPMTHRFVIATLPVIQPDFTVRAEHYVIDTSFRQFFSPPPTAAEEEWKAQNPGYAITRNPQGCILADMILLDGFFKLTEERAKLYLDCFSYGEAHVLGAAHDALSLIKPECFTEISGRYGIRQNPHLSYMDLMLDEGKRRGYEYHNPRRDIIHHKLGGRSYPPIQRLLLDEKGYSERNWLR